MTISQDLLKRIILDQHLEQSWPSSYISRTLETKLRALSQNKEIIVLTGIRRCGKSVLLEHLRRVPSSPNEYFFHFEDERLVNFTTEDFEVLHQLLISLYGVQKTFYFNEIQNIPSWELFIRRMYNSGYKIYLTGSNANLFSEHLGTRLTGRYIAVEVYPISFLEFSEYHFPQASDDLSTQDIGRLKGLFNQYLEYGGIPAFITNQEPAYLHSLYESILYKDIIARYKIGHPNALKKLVFFLASNCSKEISYSKLLGMINNAGTIIKSKTTIADYCAYIENSFLCFFVNRYDNSLKNQHQAPKKIYFIDHVLAKILGFRTSEDHSRMLENIVFLELKRRAYELYYYSAKLECDFVVRQDIETVQVIQVCLELSDPVTKQRELNGLLAAMEEFSLSSGLILTENEEYNETITHKNTAYTIIVKPLWKWLREA